MKHEKIKCEDCGEMVSSYPPILSKHMKTHSEKESVVTKVKEEKVEATVTEVKHLDKVKDPAIRQLVQIALEKEEEFRKAPEAFVAESTKDAHMELRRVYAPETMEKHIWHEGERIPEVIRGTRHAYIADPRNIKMDVQRGYVPVLDGHGGFATAPGGGILCTCSNEMFDRIEEQNVAEANKRFRNAQKGAGIDESTTDGEIDADVGGITIQKITDEID